MAWVDAFGKAAKFFDLFVLPRLGLGGSKGF
ncbi:uncharacterized protein G2W53_005051 [Senna tora]|uniref:Uncharacterized protein n=1 Tax=Senna tora TaxID=362788 RepID=A0A834XC80_9FABA|nr:uncharacterized protein G2W53_044646 [Senna tora]KAF7842753.1 uncharacterized protein G2W53_005051 [Senna tora]